jgi:hypothetical protein
MLPRFRSIAAGTMIAAASVHAVRDLGRRALTLEAALVPDSIFQIQLRERPSQSSSSC